MTATTTAVELDGADWLLREALGRTWQWYVGARLHDDEPRNNAADAAARAESTPGWFAASVPGSVVTDLWRAGEVPDPYRARQSRASEWVASRSWVYRRAVDVPSRAPDDRVVLELDGVDPCATVVWDGEVVGEVPGPYRRARFDLTGRVPVGGGRHRLAVVVHPAPENQPQVGRTELVRRHAPRMPYGWDFCPRLPHQGVWRSVRLVVGAVQLAGVTARTELADDGAAGLVHVAAAVESAAPVGLEAVVRTPEGREVGVVRASGQEQLVVRVPEPERWWPAGYGRQALYELVVRAVDDAGRSAVWSAQVGFRDVQMAPNPGAPGGALGYTAVVNGRPVELLGWNWVPIDVQYGAAAPERLEHLLDLAVASGACVLRVWGGGLVETDELYAGCDRRGLLVWQEFSQSSSGMQSAPATDDAFVRHMREEAAAVVPPRVHHPSLLLWCGGNELDLDGVPLDEARSPVLAALRDEVARLDPGRPWLPTSPSGPVFHNRLDVIATRPNDLHDVHGPWEHQGLAGHAALADAGTCLAHTEFGVEGMANRRALDALVPAHEQWPPGRENPVHRHLGEWWDNTPLVQECFGGRLTTIEGMRRASQLLQATGLAYAIEADRRRAPRCSIVLPWQLHESYPNSWCTAVVDHRGDAKPALHAVRRAFAPDRVTVRAARTAWGVGAGVAGAAPSAAAWVWSRGGVAAGSRVALRLLDDTGTSLAETAAAIVDGVAAPRAAAHLDVPAGIVPGHAVLVWEAVWTGPDGDVVDRETVLATSAADLAPLLDLDHARLDVVACREDGPAGAAWRVDVHHRGGPVVVGLELLDDRRLDAPGWAVVAGDPRPLLPGERRTLAVRWRHDDPARAPRAVTVEAWNARTTRVTEEDLA